MDATLKETKQRMDKTIEAFKHEINSIRTGKATTALLDGIKVDYYGNMSPLNQVGNLSVLDAHTLSITPWDKNMVQSIEKAIYESNMGLNPVNDGSNIKVPIPPLNEERRRELVKLVKKYGEDYKVSVRNIRRDANDTFKKQLKNKEMTEDDLKYYEGEVQEFTDMHIKNIDEIIKHKEAEIMEV